MATPLEMIRGYQTSPTSFKDNPNNMRNYGLSKSSSNDADLFNNGKNYTLANRSFTQPSLQNGLSRNNEQSFYDKMYDSSKSNLGLSDGTGTYGTWTDPSTGQSVNLDAAAYDAVQNPYVSDGTQLDFSGPNSSPALGLQTGLQGLQALSGLANAYTGYKNYGLAKDMFGFEKAATNRNIANQAQLVNNEIQNAGEVGMGLAGNTMDANARAARQAQLNTMKVSGSPVG